MKRLLLIEDDDLIYRLISGFLKNIGFDEHCIIRCTHLSDLQKINKETVEIVLTNLTLPDSAIPDTFNRVMEIFPYTPIIVLTRADEIDVAIKTLQHGALDYLIKDYLEREILTKTIQYAIKQKKMLDKIFIEKQNLSAIINNTRDIIWSIDRNYKIISANDAFWERVSIITGKKDSELHRSDFDKELFKTWADYFDRAFQGEAYKIIWNEIRSGTNIYEEVSFNPIYDSEGQVIGICCFSRDITEQRMYLNKIEKQNRQLKQIAWEQSHKVRLPVANILGLTQLLNLDKPTDINNVILLKYIRESADLLDRVIKKITAYTDTTNS